MKEMLVNIWYVDIGVEIIDIRKMNMLISIKY